MSAKKSRYVVQDKPSQNSNWGSGDLHESSVEVPLSVNHSCVLSRSWVLYQTPLILTGEYTYVKDFEVSLMALTDLNKD